jgi:hypothetical protein
MKPEKILQDAQSAPDKRGLESHRDAISLLREKEYTWREIAGFLNERGVQADHTKVFRMLNKPKPKTKTMTTQSTTIPTAAEYEKALSGIEFSDSQRAMLKAHFGAPNRSITYTELAAAAGYSDYEVANSQYGRLGKKLGEAIGFDFVDAENRPGEKFFSSSLGMPNAYTAGHFQLVMHHELAKAISSLGWF